MPHGKICYLEIPANRAEDSARFYSDIFNWKVRPRGDGNLAFDDTGGLNTVGVGSEEETFLSGEMEFEFAGGEYVVPGAGVPTSMGLEAELGLTLPVPAGEMLEPSCPLPDHAQEEDEAAEEPEPASARECTPPEKDIGEEIVALEPASIEPLSVGQQATNADLAPEGQAAISANLLAGVDQAVRPLYNGAQTFMAIRDSSAPESYAWQVKLEEDQSLKQLDSRTAGVFYETGQRAVLIEATPAHDAIGTELPTTLTVDGDDGIVLHVPHRSPSPAGGSFIYPVVAGAGWEGGFQTYSIEMPPGDDVIPQDLDVFIGESAGNASVDIGVFGAPFAGASSAGPVKEYPFRFNDCNYTYDYAPFARPSSVVRKYLLESMESCAKLNKNPESVTQDMEFRYGVTVFGVLNMIKGEEIWVEQEPVKRIKCDSWGTDSEHEIERRAAVVGCFARPWRAKKLGITLQGRFRANSHASGVPGLATCLVPHMAVYPVKPYKELRETRREMVGQFAEWEPCDWP